MMKMWMEVIASFRTFDDGTCWRLVPAWPQAQMLEEKLLQTQEEVPTEPLGQSSKNPSWTTWLSELQAITGWPGRRGIEAELRQHNVDLSCFCNRAEPLRKQEQSKLTTGEVLRLERNSEVRGYSWSRCEVKVDPDRGAKGFVDDKKRFDMINGPLICNPLYTPLEINYSD